MEPAVWFRGSGAVVSVSLRVRWVRFVAVLAAAGLLAGFAVVASQVAQAAVTGTAGEYVPAQGRILDTRNGIGGYSTPMAANVARQVQVTGTAAVPASAVTAVQVIVSAVDPTSQGVLSGGADGGGTAALMVYDGTSGGNTSNSAILAVPSDGKIQITTQTAVNVVVDVQGYYTSGNGTTAPGGYSPVAGTRILDTRSGTGIKVGTIATGTVVTVQATGLGSVPAGAAAVYVNLTVRNFGPSALITPYAADQSAPNIALDVPASNNQAIPLGAQIALSPSGAFKLYLNGHNTTTIDLSIDVEGYFTPGSSTGAFTPATGRLFDSRVKPHVSVKPNQTITVPIGGQQGTPTPGDGLEAAVVNLTALDGQTGGGYARAWADGTTEPTPYSEINYSNSIQTNLLTVPVGTDGAIEIHNVSNDTVDYVVDLEGFYQATSTTLCAKDALTLTGDTQVGADQGDPTVSAVLINSLGNPVNGEVYVQDASGNPIGGAPTATGTIDSGTRLTYHIPASSLTAGQTYTWWIHGYMPDKCAAQATSPHHTFTMGTTPTVDTTPTPGPNTLTLPASAITTTAAPQGTTCNNLACPLTTGVTKVGSDGTGDWITGLKADLSSIPAGATVNTATLTLTNTGCLTGTTCDPSTTALTPASDDISTASTGGDLAGLEAGSDSNLPIAADGTVDITGLLSDWYTSGGATNKGAILTTTSLSNGTNYTPTITITYTSATIPNPVSQLSVTAGDGGVLATWAPPANTGYVDTTGATNGISSYTVTVTDSTGQSVATVNTPGTKSVLTGLTNGAAYTVNVTATNPAGTSASASTGNIIPIAVASGPATYTSEVSKLANAQNALTTGAATSTQDAVTQVSGTTGTTAELGVTATTFEQSHDTMSNADEHHSGDSTTLSNTLVVPSADGKTATVFTTASTSGTLTDTSTGSTVSIATNDVDDAAFTMTTGATPTVVSSAETAALMAPITTSDAPTAFSATDAAAGDSSQAFTTDPATGLLKAPDGTVAAPAIFRTAARGATYHSANLAGVQRWAHWNYGVGTGTIFAKDCTDFVSRALYYGGGLPMVYSGTRDLFTRGNSSLNKFYYHGYAGWSLSWSMADYSALWQRNQGSSIYTTLLSKSVVPGDVIYANWYGTGFGHGIGHAGIIDQVVGRNLVIDQHDGKGRDTLYASSLRGIHGVWMTQRTDQFWIIRPGEQY